MARRIVSQNPNIALDDAKAQAAGHGVKITAASVAAAWRLLSRQDGAPTPPATKPATTASQRPARRAQSIGIPFDAEALVRGVIAKVRTQGAAEAERIREAMRKAVAILQARPACSRTTGASSCASARPSTKSRS